MPCVGLSPSIHTIAEFNPKHITHSGDLLSPFLHPFSACGLELIQQRLGNRVLNKNRYDYACVYAYLFDELEEICKQAIFDLRSVLNTSWDGEITYYFLGILRPNVRTCSLRYNGIKAMNRFLLGSMKDWVIVFHANGSF